MMARTISNSDDVIDSRDVIARIEELESDRQALVDTIQETEENLNETKAQPQSDTRDEVLITLADDLESAKSELAEWDEGDDATELKVLKALADDADGSGDWSYGETLIRDSYFEAYTQEMAEDIGAVGKNSDWIVIDWAKTAENLQQDYTSVDFDGETYWIRS